MNLSTQRTLWRLTGLATGALAAALARKALDRLWQSVRGAEPPRNPASRETTWGEAIAWAAASGVAMGVARLVTARGAAAGWQAATGALPPDLEEVGA